MLLGDELLSRGVPVDMEILLRTAIMHDWAETRVGDMPRTAAKYFGTDARKQAEASALADIVSESTSNELYRRLYADYEHRASFEARLVKASDIIDLLVQTLAMERAGARGLDEFWQVAENAEFNLKGEAQIVVNEILQALLLARPDSRI
jgi:putative hydrolase of HD superfamily